MGKTVAGHGNTKRGLEIEAHAEEAVIHWNAPSLALSQQLCKLTLQCMYNARWHAAFSHTGDRGHYGSGARKRKAYFLSATAEKQVAKKAKLGFMARAFGSSTALDRSSNAGSSSSSSSSS
jgi:hypothetical protein